MTSINQCVGVILLNISGLNKRKSKKMKTKTRILSIDGGGIKGIVPAVVLNHLEKYLKQLSNNPNARIIDYFDLFSGASTGAIIIAGLLTPDNHDRPKFTAEEIERLNKIEPSRISLSPRMLKSQPALAEPDLFRTIQSLPGVLTTSEFSTGLVIRGGNTDQNLILLDGITVYNPSHLGGVFSNFIVDAVKEAELIKGGYNAEYGGRLSAV